MEIQILSNAGQIGRVFSDLAQKQMPFAMSTAINETAKDCSLAATAAIGEHFKIRNKGLLVRKKKGNPIEVNWSSKRQFPDVRAAVGVTKRYQFLADHEYGTSRRGIRGNRRTIPTRAVHQRRTRTGKIAATDRVGGQAMKGSAINKKGKRGKYSPAFEVKKSGMLARRVKAGRGKRAKRQLEFLFSLRPVVRIDKRPWFVKAVTDTASRVYDKHFDEALEIAIKSARVRAGSFTSDQGRGAWLVARSRVRASR